MDNQTERDGEGSPNSSSCLWEAALGRLGRGGKPNWECRSPAGIGREGAGAAGACQREAGV